MAWFDSKMGAGEFVPEIYDVRAASPIHHNLHHLPCTCVYAFLVQAVVPNSRHPLRLPLLMLVPILLTPRCAVTSCLYDGYFVEVTRWELTKYRPHPTSTHP